MNISSVAFIVNDNIVFGQNRQSRLVVYTRAVEKPMPKSILEDDFLLRNDPSMQLPERYERMQKKHVIVKAHNVGLSIDKLQVCLSSPEHFLMSVRKDLVRLHFDELPSYS